MSRKKSEMTDDERLTRRAKTRLHKTKQSAQSRRKEFNLTLDYMKNILRQTHCAYSGEPFSDKIGPDLMTLERWDCDKGYVMGNVIPVKHKYNSLRGNLSFEQLCGSEYSKKVEAARLDRPETLRGKVKDYYETIERIRKNQAGRKKKVEELLAKVILTEAEQLTLNVALKRLDSSELEVKSIEARMAKELKKIKSDVRHGVKTSQTAAEGYGIIAQGLLKYLNATPEQIANLNKGLPLDGELECITDTPCTTKTKMDSNSQSSTLVPAKKLSLYRRIVLWLNDSWKNTKITLKECFTQNLLQ